MILTKSTGVNVPNSQIAMIREQVPETREMSIARILRYSLARTIGLTHDQAIRASGDARIAETELPRV